MGCSWSTCYDILLSIYLHIQIHTHTLRLAGLNTSRRTVVWAVQCLWMEWASATRLISVFLSLSLNLRPYLPLFLSLPVTKTSVSVAHCSSHSPWQNTDSLNWLTLLKASWDTISGIIAFIIHICLLCLCVSQKETVYSVCRHSHQVFLKKLNYFVI